MPPFSIDQTDALIVFALTVAGLAVLRVAYAAAGSIWDERHQITLHLGGRSRKISGYWGEVVLGFFGFLIFLGADGLAPDIRLWTLLRDFPVTNAAIVGAAFVVYAYYARSVLLDAKTNESHRGPIHYRRLRKTYLIYSPCAVLIYCVSTAAIAILTLQYLRNASTVATHRAEIVTQLNNLATVKSADVIQSAVEMSYSDIVQTGNSVAASIAPIFLMIAAIMGIVLLVTASPIKTVLRQDSRNVTQYSAFIIAALIFGLTTGTYYFSYSRLLTDSLNAIIAIRPALAHANWQVLERFNEIVLDLEHKRSFVGFLAMVANESGIAVIAMALFQWLLSEMHPFRRAA
ncbi:MAG TPA: hypothetical protein VGT78_10345 [Rhizomicrobium sp.]|nr:hypothetical protein [Rhizomicrobium sp.]